MLAHAHSSAAAPLAHNDDVAPDSGIQPRFSARAFRRDLAAITPELFGRAMRMARNEAAAEDLVQDTVERAMRFERQYQPGTNLRAWVNQILFSVFITGCRRARRERNAISVLTTDPAAWTHKDEVAPAQVLSPAVMRALDAMPSTFGEVVRLVDLEERSYKDAATRLGVPVGTVMSRLHRGRKMLAAAIAVPQKSWQVMEA